MINEGTVSLWIGNISSEAELSKYVEIIYSEDEEEEEDYIKLSKFLEDFKIDIDDFDEDFIEAIFLSKQVTSVEELLNGCSYENIVIPKYKEMTEILSEKKFNAGILLYNFEYEKTIEKADNGFEFVGSIGYMD